MVHDDRSTRAGVTLPTGETICAIVLRLGLNHGNQGINFLKDTDIQKRLIVFDKLM